MILITGGMGFIGLHLALDLVNKGKKILLLSRRPVKVPPFLAPYWDNQVKGTSADILDLPNLFDLIKNNSVESIIHSAAAWENSGNLFHTVKINIEGTLNILEAARIFSLRRVTFISSTTVYLGSTAKLVTENTDLPASSPSFIPAFKKAGEQICFLYAREYGLSIPVLRVSRVYGPLGHEGSNPIQIMARNAMEGKQADLRGFWGELFSNHVYIKDAVKGIALVHFAKSLKHKIYNIGDSSEHNLLEAAQIVKSIIPNAEILLSSVKTEHDITRPPLDISQIRKEMGYVPEYDLKKGIMSYIDFLKNQRIRE